VKGEKKYIWKKNEEKERKRAKKNQQKGVRRLPELFVQVLSVGRENKLGPSLREFFSP
jgi:hypothetical protein